MFYTVGLGNLGEEYKNTRHNVGWQALDFVCGQAHFPSLVKSAQYSGEVAEGIIADESVFVLYPDTYMNNSGSAVAKLVPRELTHKLVVLHDDIALPFGELRVSYGRGDAGHNGIKSIIEKLGTKDFSRIRIGIAPRSLLTGKAVRPRSGTPLERFVLKPFTKKELDKLAEVNERIYAALETIIKDGVEAAMNQHN
ncbi:MAG: aminoacyl-tRNA hydrolase [Patescibacteria group bacterium]